MDAPRASFCFARKSSGSVPPLVDAEKFSGTEECTHCHLCGCCAMALQDTGDLMGADKDQCMMWREGYVDRIRQVAEEAVRRYFPEGEKNEATAG